MKLLLPGALFVAIVFSSCAVKKEPVSAGNLVIDGKIWSALWHQRAAEYKALCFQAYNVAKFRLDKALKQKHDKPLAIITDIDETVLDNSPNTVSQALVGKDFETEAWYAWTAKASADTIPGSA
ncbi:MAG: HAD family acid phosphatase, partial [Sphingobacteriaceae bacterium]